MEALPIEPETSPRFSLRISHILYAVAFTAASFALPDTKEYLATRNWRVILYNLPEILLFPVVINANWCLAFYFFCKPGRWKLLSFLCLTPIVLAIVNNHHFVTDPFYQGHISDPEWCEDSLEVIVKAIRGYERENGHLPPAYIADENGNPMHSWRVLILPYMESKKAKVVYTKYDFNQAWNSDNNKVLLNNWQSPSTSIGFSCWRNDTMTDGTRFRESMTCYKVVTGADTAFVADKFTSSKDLESRRSNFIFLVEDIRNPIEWMCPEDITLDEALEFLSDTDFTVGSAHTGSSWMATRYCGTHVAKLDGELVRVHSGRNSDFSREMFTLDGGAAQGLQSQEPIYIRNWPQTIALHANLLLIAFPFVFLVPKWIRYLRALKQTDAADLGKTPINEDVTH